LGHRFIPICPVKLTWVDGVPYSPLFEDVYFCRENGVLESQHVFLEGNDLAVRFSALKDNHFVIAETGFGTGLNFLLTWALWKKHASPLAQLFYYSAELHPLTHTDLAQVLQLFPELIDEANALLETYPILTPGMHALHFDNHKVNLILMLGDAKESYKSLLSAPTALLNHETCLTKIDAWFLDGFAPSKNPEVWQQGLFNIMAYLSTPKTTVATFSAATMVKQGLTAAGFEVEKRQGYGRKRDMTVAKFKSSVGLPNQKIPSPWAFVGWALAQQKAMLGQGPTYVQEAQAGNNRVIVLGAGLSGCMMAYQLASLGYEVYLLDKENRVAAQASGNPYTVLFPKLSAFKAPMTDFMLSSYLYALNFYQALGVGDFTPLLMLAHNEREIKSQAHLKEWLLTYPEIGAWVDETTASTLLGLKAKTSGIIMHQSMTVNSQLLCERLIASTNIHFMPNVCVDALKFENGLWDIGDVQAPYVVLTTGHELGNFKETVHFPVTATVGQMSFVKASSYTASLKIPVCGEGHILPAKEGIHGIGATYHLKKTSFQSSIEDDKQNMAKIAAQFNIPIDALTLTGNWGGVRAATPDYLPLVGPVPDSEAFMKQFEAFKYNSKAWVAAAMPALKGLYVCAGFGSRGLTTLPLASYWLTSLIHQQPSVLPREQIQAISPARFLRKQLIV